MERLAFGRPATQVTPWALPRPNTILVGRVMLGAIFLLSGFEKLADFSTSVGYLSAKVPPVAAPILLAIAAFAELAGGMSLVTGTLARIGGLSLFLYLIPTTLLFHNFWAVGMTG